MDGPDRDRVTDWIAAYERAWRSAGTDPLADLFTEDATYSQGPYEITRRGLAEIAEMWEAERDGPGEEFTMSSEIVALDGDTAVARVEVVYGDAGRSEYRDLWVMRFAEDGRCRAYEEWPFWPDRAIVAPER